MEGVPGSKRAHRATPGAKPGCNFKLEETSRRVANAWKREPCLIGNIRYAETSPVGGKYAYNAGQDGRSDCLVKRKV